MSAVHEYVEKCLAECPEGAEELLLAALLKKRITHSDPEEQLVVFDEKGVCLGHFEPSLDDAFLEATFPEGMAAIRRRDAGMPDEPGISGEEFCAEQKRIIAELEQQLAEESLHADKSA